MYDYLFYLHAFTTNDVATDETTIQAFIADGAAKGYRLVILEASDERVLIAMERKSEPLK